MPGPVAASNEGSPRTDLREPVGRTVEELPDGLPGEGAGDLVRGATGAPRGARRAWPASRRSGPRTRARPCGAGRLRGRRPQPRREGLRLGRGAARPAARARLPVRLRGRNPPREVPGRRLRERGRDGGDRRQRRRPPRASPSPPGAGRAPPTAQVPRPARRAHARRRRGGRRGRRGRRGLPRRGLPGTRGALPQERALEGAQAQEAEGRVRAQGDPRHGAARGVRGQGAGGRGGTRGAGAGGGRQGRPRGPRRDPGLRALPPRALEAHTRQQRHRAPRPRDPQEDAGRRRTFPDGRGALMPVGARLRRVAEGEWGPGRRLDATLPDGWPHRGGPMGCLKVRKNLDGAGLNAAH